ncbi:MAG: LysR family transcriptional regulator [Pseudomonadota bacterium]
MRLLDWDTLRVVLHIHREGGLKQAARRLKVSQPTVSRHLAKAETALKSRLFDRRHRRLVATEAGMMIVQEALTIEEKIIRLQDSVSTIDNEMSGPINITVPQHVMPYLMTEEIGQFKAMYPDVQFNLHISDELMDFRVGKVDIVIRAEENPKPSFWGKKIAMLHYGYFARPDLIEAYEQGGSLSQSELPLVIHNGVKYSSGPELRHHFPNGQIVATSNNLEAEVAMIRAGLCLGRLPHLVGNNLDGVVEINCTKPETTRALWILTHKDLRHVKRFSVFIDFVAERLEKKHSLFQPQAAE